MRVFGRHPLQLIIAAAAFFAGVMCIELAVPLTTEHPAAKGVLVAVGLSCYAVAVVVLRRKPAKSS